MSLHAPVLLVCPHCREPFSVSARLVRPSASACCPGCGESFALAGMQDALKKAKALRRQRRERRDTLLGYLRQPAPEKSATRATTERPMQMGDVLRRLDDLLQRLEALPDRRAAS